MKKQLALACALVLLGLFAVTAQEEGKDKKFDSSKLVGDWHYVSGEKGGEKVDLDKLKGQPVKITKDKIVLEGEMKFVFKYELDTKAKPMGIKMTILESPFGEGATAAGIIELKGDVLKLCYAADKDEATPKTFETKKDSKQNMFVLKKGKAKKAE